MPPVSNSREKLLTTALQQIWSSSYSSVSVDEICRSAGVKKGSFYHHFKSKAELAHTALEWSWEQALPELNRLFSAENEPLDRLRLYLQFEVEEQTRHFKTYGQVLGCPYASIASQQCGNESELQEKACLYLSRLAAFFESALREAQSRGDIGASVAADILTDAFCNLFFGALLQARIRNDLSRLEGLVERCLETCIALAAWQQDGLNKRGQTSSI